MPQQNGIVESMNRTLMENARSMLSGARLTQHYRVEVVDTTCYLVNRSMKMALVNKTPYEAWVGRNPSLAHLILFGCDSFVHIPKEKRSKLNTKLEKCIFIEYMD